MKVEMHPGTKAGTKAGPKPSPQAGPKPSPQAGPKPSPQAGTKAGPTPDILQLSGQAQHTLKSTCITGILEAEAAFMMESAIRFIDATDDLVFQEAFYSS